MKKIIILLTLCVATTISFAQAKLETLEIKTSGFNNQEFVQQDKVFTKFIIEQVEAEKPFNLNIIGSSNTVTIVKAPKSAVNRQMIDSLVKPFTGRTLRVQLHKDETVEYEITIDSVKDDTLRATHKYVVTLSTNTEYRPNCNFIFLSAIRSVAGTAPSNEFFDLNLKFNYGGHWFTLLGLDLSLSPPAKTDSTQLRINEAFASANIFFPRGPALISGKLNRAMFAGGGAKVFNQRPYGGLHLGSLEINGPLFSSYLFAGYYRELYGGYAKVQNEKSAVLFRNNFYAECALAFDNKKDVAGILSDIRIKIGILAPFTHSDQDIVKPGSKDVQYRIVLEVPIGGIFKFGGELVPEDAKSKKWWK
ncbi:MAG TPA: hypothetical protein VF473_06265 [Cyclobacteriaceae bacterium]